ncbi:MAG: gluconokinase [Pseudomonadota bacterium]
MAVHVVVMGVSGCGKSVVGNAIAAEMGLPMIEGDAFHPPSNVEKMRRGQPLQDADRAGWLARLGEELALHPEGAVLACSALKRAYRDVLRSHSAHVKFIHLELSQDEALRRVAERGGHFYPPSLVASQFAALENPAGEAGVLAVAATLPVVEITRLASHWLRSVAFNNP